MTGALAATFALCWPLLCAPSHLPKDTGAQGRVLLGMHQDLARISDGVHWWREGGGVDAALDSRFPKDRSPSARTLPWKELVAFLPLSGVLLECCSFTVKAVSHLNGCW